MFLFCSSSFPSILALPSSSFIYCPFLHLPPPSLDPPFHVFSIPSFFFVFPRLLSLCQCIVLNIKLGLARSRARVMARLEAGISLGLGLGLEAGLGLGLGGIGTIVLLVDTSHWISVIMLVGQQFGYLWRTLISILSSFTFSVQQLFRSLSPILLSLTLSYFSNHPIPLTTSLSPSLPPLPPTLCTTSWQRLEFSDIRRLHVLHYACARGQTELVTKLLQVGVSVDTVGGKLRQTPLMLGKVWILYAIDSWQAPASVSYT